MMKFMQENFQIFAEKILLRLDFVAKVWGKYFKK